MKRPLIGVSGSHLITGEGAFAGYHRSYVNDDYIRSVTEAGGVPVIVPFNPDDKAVAEVMDRVDGLVLSGGQDICPLNYGEEPLRNIGPVWPERDHFDFLLLKLAEKRGIPVMGICRGIQIINVFHGGTMYQDLVYDENSYVKHSQNQSAETPTHTIALEKDSHFASIIGETKWVTNSHHHQTIKKLGKGLRVVARAEDGTVESVEGTGENYLQGYQFHPEMMSINNATAKLLFKDFVKNASKKGK